MTAAEIARVVGGKVEGNAAVPLIGAEVDSRRLERGDLFVALPGARCDGHDFVGGALEIAAAAMVRSTRRAAPRHHRAPHITPCGASSSGIHRTDRPTKNHPGEAGSRYS